MWDRGAEDILSLEESKCKRAPAEYSASAGLQVMGRQCLPVVCMQTLTTDSADVILPIKVT